MNTNAVAHLKTVNDVHRELRRLANWEDEALGMGNRYYAPPTRNQWARLDRQRERLMRRLWAIQASQRNRPRRPVRAARVIQKVFKNMYYAPNNNGSGLRGRGYRTAMARVRGNNASQVGPREHITHILKTKLNNLRHQKNRGAMVNIYNGMYKKWTAAGGIYGANVMNNAQKIMFRAGLI